VLPQLADALEVEANGFLRPNGIDRECRQGVPQLVAPDSAQELHRADVVLVQTLGELLEHRVEGIGGNAFDDQLAPGDSDRQRLPLAYEQHPQAIRDSVYRPV